MNNVRVLARSSSWIEGEAIRQLEHVAQLPGMCACVGLPDLHPGKGTPIGAAFLSDGVVYPHLVGSDIGCGMALYRTGIATSDFRADRIAKKLRGLDEPCSEEVVSREPLLHEAWLRPFDASLGSIGGGNHFAEFLLPVSGNVPEEVLLLIHSGSRGLGDWILRQHTETRGASSLKEGTEECDQYLQRHESARAWAAINRKLIAEKFQQRVGCDLTPMLTVDHNFVERTHAGFLHRKGAAPVDRGMVIVPGSRGTHSYLFEPAADTQHSLCSLAHGAGRKWKRSEAKDRLSQRYSPKDLERTALGGVVICEDRDLIYEEAPEAYKKIDQVIGDMVELGLGVVRAMLKPVLTYKVRR